MTLAQLLKYYGPSDEMIKNGDREAFRTRAGLSRRAKIKSVAEINAFVAENVNDDPVPQLNDKFTPEEQAERRRLSDQASEIIIREAEKIYFDNKPSSKGLRYPETMMMRPGTTPEEQARNQRILDLFDDPAADPAAFIRLHKELLDRLQAMDPVTMVSTQWSDQQIIDHADDFFFLSYMGLQFQNFENQLKRVKDLQLDDATRRSLNECEEIMRKYMPLTEQMTSYAEHIGAIANPYYAEIDPNDPETAQVCDLFEGRSILETDELEPLPAEEQQQVGGRLNHRDDFGFFSIIVSQHTSRTVSVEAEAIIQIMDARECGEENLVYRMVGADGQESEERKLDKNAILNDVTGNMRARAVVYDKTDRAGTEMTLASCEKPEYCISVAQATTAVKPPEQPFCEEPGEPPEAPGFGAQLIHAVFSSYDAERFASYDAAMAEYRERVNRYQTYQREHEAWRVTRALFDKANPDYMNLKQGRLVTDFEMNVREDDLTTAEALRTIRCVFGADRERREDWIHDNVYNGDTFREMQQSRFDLRTMTPEGREVDDMTFAFLSMTMSLSPQFLAGRKGAPDSATFDDIIQQGTGHGPRANIGLFMRQTIDPARRAVADCLTHFDTPMPGHEPATGREMFARLIAPAINTAAEHMGTKRWSSQTPVVLNETISQVLTFAEQYGMMDLLKDAGLTDKAVDTVRAGQLAGQIYMEGKKAEMALLNETERGIPLTEAQRRACAEAIIRSRTLTAVSNRWVDSCDIGIDHLPEKQKGESEADYQKRLDEFNERLMAFMDKGDAGRKEYAPEVYDLLHGGRQLDRIAGLLMPAEEREHMIQAGSGAILKTTVLDVACFDKRLKAAGQIEPEVQPEPEKAPEKQPEPEKAQQPVRMSRFSKMVQKLEEKQPFGEGESLPIELKENIRGMSERSVLAERTLRERMADGKAFVGGREVKDMVAFRELERISEADSPDPEKLSFFSRKDSGLLADAVSERTAEVKFAADRPHEPSFYEKNILTEEGLDSLASRFDEQLGFVIVDAKQHISEELEHYEQNMLKDVRAPKQETDPSLAHYEENMLRMDK